MKFTPYSEPSDKEIDALHPPPCCPECGEPVETYDELCTDCEDELNNLRLADILQDNLKYPNN